MDKFEKCITVDTKVLPAVLRNNAGIIGAAVHASNEKAKMRSSKTKSSTSKTESILYEKLGRYKGALNDQDKPHGIGRFEFFNGSVYIGQFNNGKLEGLGCLENKADNYCYKGEWRNWQKEGKGLEKSFDTGESYDGKWKAGKRNGYGNLRLFNK